MLFGTDGIRGIVDKEINSNMAYDIGKGLAIYLIEHNYRNTVLTNFMDIVSELLEECKNFNISSDRVFSIVNNKEFKKEKFGTDEIENIEGNFEFKNVKFGYNENNILINDLTFDLGRGEKFLIVGENGIGKSTLLKLIVGNLTPLLGEIDINIKTEIGYYAQEHELLNNDINILENFSDSGLSIKELRSFLGNFLFSGDEVYKKVSYLSPGERSRVALAKLALTGANLLILDEPTNHLDPETQRLIADTFRDYEGTMLIVSHNPEFVDNLGVERMLMLPSGEIRYYDKETILYYQELNNQSKYNK